MTERSTAMAQHAHHQGGIVDVQQLAVVVFVLAVIVAGCSSVSETSETTATAISPPTISVPTTTTTAATIDSEPSAGATSGPTKTALRSTADLQSIANAAGNALIYVSDQHGTTTVVSGEGEDGATIKPDDAFFIGSGSKMITAAAILQLVDQGLIGLDDLLEDYVEFEVSTPITIRHLLQHKSGLGDDDSIYDTCDPDVVMDGLAAQATRPFNLEPGAGASYSTNGFNMLSLVMSSATRQSAADVVRQNIFEPLGMTSTYFTGAEDGPPLVVGGGSLEPDCPAKRMDIGTGGGFASSAADLDTFMRTLFEGDLLTEESLKEMMTVDSQVNGFDYGLGLGVLYPPDGTDQPMYGHWGAFGWQAGALYDPQSHRTISVLIPGQGFLGTVWEAANWANGN
jgi:D-alanyl-D-alanine carboxypeptidase